MKLKNRKKSKRKGWKKKRRNDLAEDLYVFDSIQAEMIDKNFIENNHSMSDEPSLIITNTKQTN